MSENFSSQPDGMQQDGIQARIGPGSRIAGYLIEEQAVPYLSPDGKTVYIPGNSSTPAQLWNVGTQSSVTPGDPLAQGRQRPRLRHRWPYRGHQPAERGLLRRVERLHADPMRSE